MKVYLLLAAFSLIYAPAYAIEGTGEAMVTKLTGYVCHQTLADGNQGSNFFIQVSTNGFDVLQANEHSNEKIEVKGVAVRAARYPEPFIRQQTDENNLTLVRKFGTRFALTGYYGDTTISINLENETGSFRHHRIPHLIADINAPEAESIYVTQLQCEKN